MQVVGVHARSRTPLCTKIEEKEEEEKAEEAAATAAA